MINDSRYFFYRRLDGQNSVTMAGGASDAYLKRIVNISSHSKHSGYELAELSQDDKRVLGFLLDATINKKFEFHERYQVALKEEAQNE